MFDMEEMILQMQDSEANECNSCEYAKAGKCKNQCMEIEEHYNPNLQ